MWKIYSLVSMSGKNALEQSQGSPCRMHTPGTGIFAPHWNGARFIWRVKPLFSFIYTGCNEDSQGERRFSRISVMGASGFIAPFLGVAFRSSSSGERGKLFWDQLQTVWLRNSGTGWRAEQRAGNASALVVCLGFVEYDHQLTAAVLRITLDHRPLEKELTAPIFSSNSPSAKQLLPLGHFRHLLVPVWGWGPTAGWRRAS